MRRFFLLTSSRRARTRRRRRSPARHRHDRRRHPHALTRLLLPQPRPDAHHLNACLRRSLLAGRCPSRISRAPRLRIRRPPPKTNHLPPRKRLSGRPSHVSRHYAQRAIPRLCRPLAHPRSPALRRAHPYKRWLAALWLRGPWRTHRTRIKPGPPKYRNRRIPGHAL